MISIMANYWFINKTGLPIMIREAGYTKTLAGVQANEDQVSSKSQWIKSC